MSQWKAYYCSTEEDDEYPERYEALSADGAAESFANDVFNGECFNVLRVFVTDENGTKTTWDVTAETEPTFQASEVKP